MAEGFYVTNKGLTEITKAIESDTKVEIKKARFGSGATLGDEWDYDITSLKNSRYEKDLDPLTDTYDVNPDDPKSLKINVIVPVGQALTINEIGFFDRNDNLILYGIVRERIKSDVDEFEYRCLVKFDNTDESKVEIVIKSPEFEKVEELVENSKQEFEQNKTQFESEIDEKIKQVSQTLEQAESDFDLSNYVSHAEYQTLLDMVDSSNAIMEEYVG